jgi:hypothetical protein
MPLSFAQFEREVTMRSSEQDTIASLQYSRIRALNDRLRTHRKGGKIMMTRGVGAPCDGLSCLPSSPRKRLLERNR